MLSKGELIRFEAMLAAGSDRSDPHTLSATDQMMQDMMQQAEMVTAVQEAADRQRAMEEGMERAMQDVERAARQQEAHQQEAHQAVNERAERENAAHEAAHERAVAEHHERNIAAADRIHEARAMQGGDEDREFRTDSAPIGDLRSMSFEELLGARARALNLPN